MFLTALIEEFYNIGVQCQVEHNKKCISVDRDLMEK